MKYYAVFILFIILFGNCKNREQLIQTIENQKNRKFNLSDYYNKFKFHNIRQFNIDTFPFGERMRYYQQADSTLLSCIFKKEIPMHELWFYYSTFQDPTLITLLQESDEFGPIIWLVKFDEKGQFSDKTIIAMSSGDAGDTWQRTGTFDGNNAFTLQSIYKIWNKEKTQAANIDTTYVKVFLDKNIFKKEPIYRG